MCGLPTSGKKIALLATNAFRITAPTKYLSSSIFFEYIVERTDIPPNPTHRKIRFGLYIILVRQRKKIKKKSLKKNRKILHYFSIYPFTLYTIALYSRNFVRSKHLVVFLNRFSKETCKRTSLEAAQCYKIWEKLCDNCIVFWKHIFLKFITISNFRAGRHTPFENNLQNYHRLHF